MSKDYVPLERLLRERYQPSEWALIFELTKGVGYSGGDGAIDAAAFNCWPSKGHHRLAFEVKRTRGDFLRELRTPKKRAWVEENFHQCYFVTPHGLVTKDEIPDGWGLIYATKAGDKLIQKKQAKHMKVPPLPETIALAALRGAANLLARAQGKTYEFEGREIGEAELDTIVAKRCERYIERHTQLTKEAEGHVNALKAERVALQAPFRELEASMHTYGYHPDPDRPMTGITGPDVRQMLQNAERRFRAKVIKELLEPIARVRDTTAYLLREAAKEHADDVVPSESKRMFGD